MSEGQGLASGSDVGNLQSQVERPQVHFVLVLHSHQPVGNLDLAVQYAADVGYGPWLRVLADYPELPVCLHYSGSLLEWFETNAPQLIDLIGKLAERGQAELIGGAFYDPILTMLPEEDRRGQIETFSEYLHKRFGQRPRGAWLAERVWEQCLTRSLVDAGLQYTTLDDSHFRSAGLTDAELVGGFLTEDDGRLLRVYPASEELRYRIPFQEPERTLELLSQYAQVGGGNVIVYADDGEKFGSWPETHKHVYEDGWLRRWIELLLRNRDWLRITTLAEVADRIPPVGKVYLPDASYREMTEWALPARRLVAYEELVEQLKREGRYEQMKPFLKLGQWRNFKSKYREANLLYAKSLSVSRKVNALTVRRPRRSRAGQVARARQELYRGQCNCPYWHGVFGGLYLPHLRSAAYSKLIAAEAIADQLTHRGRSWLDLDRSDFDLDGRDEVLLSSAHLALGLVPHRGGHLFELDLRARQFNLANSLTRRFEAYHHLLTAPGTAGEASGEVKTIHEIVSVKTPGLEEKLYYDRYERESLVDHCFVPEVTLADLDALSYEELGDFVEGPYEVADVQSKRGQVLVHLSRRGTVRRPEEPSETPGLPLSVEKTVALPRNRSELTVTYTLTNLSKERLRFRFAVEWNFSLLAGDAPDRYYFLPPRPSRGRVPRPVLPVLSQVEGSGRAHQEVDLGPLASRHSLTGGQRLGLRDEWTGMELVLRTSRPEGWFLLPIESVSQSEGGLESVYQSSCVMPHWLIDLADGAEQELKLRLTITELPPGSG